MSNYHVKTQIKTARTAVVVFHIAMPDDTNSASYSLRSAVSEYVDGANFTSAVSWIAAQELTDLQNGLLFEVVETIKFLAADSNTQKQTKIDNRYTALTTSTVDKMKTILKFWHLNRDIP